MKLSIVYFNDVHGYAQPHAELFYEGGKEVVKTAGGYSRIAGFIQQLRESKDHVLVFDGGDTFHGTYPVVQSKGEALVPVLNKLGIDAMVGHWDFAYGPDHLLNLSAQLHYPVLAINVYKEDGSLFLPPYKMMDAGGVKIAVIGICANIIDKTMPPRFSEGLHVTDGTEELPRYIEKVKTEGADLGFLLSHNGFPQDCYLLSKTKGIDVCLSAHTHNQLYEPVMVGDAMVIQCGCHGSFLGHLELDIQDKKIVSSQYRLQTVDEHLPVQPEVEELSEAMLLPHRDFLSQPAGETPCVLHRYNTLHSSLDNLLLAAMMHATATELAFSNGWRYGAPVNAGTITMNDLFNIVPHNPQVATTLLTGEEIRQMLEENLERTFSCEPMQQMGGYVKRCMGLTACIKIENPAGARIQQLFVGKEPYESSRTYKAAFITMQGVPPKFGSERTQTGIHAVEAMVAYLKSGTFNFEVATSNAFIPV